MKKKALLLAALVGALLFPAALRAETVELLDGTRIIGELVHYYDGVLTFTTAEGTMKIDRRNIKSIVFKLPDPRAEFATPEKALEFWRGRMAAGDFAGAVSAYSLIYQGQVAGQFEQLSLDDKAKMKDEVGRTAFRIIEAKIDGRRAVLKVERKIGETADTAFLNFVLENQEWKMTP